MSHKKHRNPKGEQVETSTNIFTHAKESVPNRDRIIFSTAYILAEL